MTKLDKSRTGKFVQATSNYARKACVCGRSFIFKPTTPYKFCEYCGRKVINTTRGRFIYTLSKMINKDKLEKENK